MLCLREVFDFVLVVGGSSTDVGGGRPGKAFPLQEARQCRVAGVVVVGRPGEVTDVVKSHSGQRDRRGKPVEFVSEHDLPQCALVAVIAVEALLVDSRALGDSGHCGAVESVLRELHGGGFFESAPGAFGIPSHFSTVDHFQRERCKWRREVVSWPISNDSVGDVQGS